MNKANKTQVFVIILGIVVVLGLVLIFTRQYFNYSGFAFDILTYVLSIVALVLAVLSVVNGLRQGRVMKQIVHDVHIELKQMADLNVKIEQGIKEDREVNEVISKVLSKYGIDETDRVRSKIHHHTEKHIKKHGL